MMDVYLIQNERCFVDEGSWLKSSSTLKMVMVVFKIEGKDNKIKRSLK